ncbi:MAG: sulfite exporter TauE/SafE family protein [Acutalibacteraceae bacterium]
MNIYIILFSFLAGIIGSMGFGSGTVLIIYLTVFLSLEQTLAQGINLLFFIPCAVFAIIVYSKQKLIDKSIIASIIFPGMIGVGLGYFTLYHINTNLLSKLFGAFLILLALNELFFSKKKKGLSHLAQNKKQNEQK